MKSGNNKHRTFGKVTFLICIFSGLSAILGGCSVKDISTNVQNTVKGDYYLTENKYAQGKESFAREVKENPESATANYYYGRFLLYDKQYKSARTHLEKARKLNPDNPDYHFWEGISHSALGNTKDETNSYRSALRLKPDHLQSLTYMGHNRLSAKKYTEALEYYTKALDIWPESPSALYNRALIMQQLNRTPEEKIAWLEYLSWYPSGEKARKATTRLNSLDDFSYRNHTLGARTVTTEKIYFVPFTDQLYSGSYESLDLIGGVASKMKKGKLQVIVYQKNNKELAKNRAVTIKNYLMKEYPGLTKDRIGISWFSHPQKVKQGKSTYTIDESVQFFISK